LSDLLKRLEPAAITRVPLGDLMGDVSHGLSTSWVDRAPAITGRRLRILLAEASADDRFVIRVHLNHTSYQLEETEDAVSAANKFKLGRYDFVLLGQHGSQADCCSAARELRQCETIRGLPHAPLMGLISSTLSEGKYSPLVSSCDSHITKPVSRTALLDAIAFWASSVDPIALAELRALDEPGEGSLLKALIEQFLRDLDPRLTALKEAYSADDAGKVQMAAHAIRGSCGHFGAHRMARLCASLDRYDVEINPESHEVIAELENEAMHVRLILASQLDRIDGAVSCTTPTLSMSGSRDQHR
jgi:CheY-like chemotaxis protein